MPRARLLLLAAIFAFLAPAMSNAQDGSRILSIDEGEMPRGWSGRLAEAEAKLPAFDRSGYNRPDFLPEIFARRLDLVPARGLDNVRYWATAVADLAAACPALGLDIESRDALPYVFSSAADLFNRFNSGSLSDSEIIQAGWMAILGLSSANACSWDPSGAITRDQAQAMCEDAAAARRDLGVLPSLDARHDVALFLSRNGCTSPQARHLAEGLQIFGRQAPGRIFRSAGLPPDSLPEGAAYREILQNCIRGSFSENEYAWCGCYVGTLYSLAPSRETVDALARDPFADITYMRRILDLPGGQAVYQCEQHLGHRDKRELYREKFTACLVDSVARADGLNDCTYRAAWGTFALVAETCRSEITSRSWGSEEVDCAAGGAPAASVEGPHRWKDGRLTVIDWESPVPIDFEPLLPEDARESHPMEMRFLHRKGPDQLTRMSLTMLTEMVLFSGRPVMPNDPLFNVVGPVMARLDAEGALVLGCSWTTGQGTVRKRHYWYQETPEFVASAAFNPRLAEAFASIGAARETCPSRYPG